MKTDFADSSYWDALAKKYLKSYTLPKWDKPMTEEGMRRWKDRLNISERLYSDYQDFDELNPDWPLRAFVGLLMETKDVYF